MDRGSGSPFAGKHVLLVGTGGVKRRRVIEALRALGLARITCLHDAPNWAAPFVDDWIEADSVTWSPRTTTVVKSRIGAPDGVLTYDDYSVVVAAHLAHDLELPGLAPGAAARSKDKAAFRAACVEHGVPAPRFARIDARAAGRDAAGLDEALASAGIAFPVVTKPAHGGGSVLVRRAKDRAELRRNLDEYVAALETEPAAKLWPDASVLVEEYLAGPEVDIDMIVQGGELRYAQVTDNFAPIEPYFMELGGQLPSTLPDEAQRELVRVAHAALRAIGALDAVVHFEARWTARGAIPIEANLRIGGAEVYAFTRDAFGVDLVEAAARLALGAPVPDLRDRAPRMFLRSTALNPESSGRIASIDVEPRIWSDPALGELCIFREVGTSVRVPPDGFDYIGWMVARGATRPEADENLARLRACVRFVIASEAGAR